MDRFEVADMLARAIMEYVSDPSMPLVLADGIAHLVLDKLDEIGYGQPNAD